MQLLVIQFTMKMFHVGFIQVLISQSLKSQYYRIYKTLKLSYLQYNGLKSLCCYNSHAFTHGGGRIQSLYVHATVVPARYSFCQPMRMLSSKRKTNESIFIKSDTEYFEHVDVLKCE
jgi:hypothetical protein